MAIGTLLASELARSLTPLTTKFFGIPLICTFYIDFVIKTSHLLLIFSVDCMQSSVCTLFSRCEFSLIALSLCGCQLGWCFGAHWCTDCRRFMPQPQRTMFNIIQCTNSQNRTVFFFIFIWVFLCALLFYRCDIIYEIIIFRAVQCTAL